MDIATEAADAGAGNLLFVSINGTIAPEPGLSQITLVSPDLNADEVVNLVDVAIFASDFASPATTRRSDFAWDGILNLADVSILAWHLGAACP